MADNDNDVIGSVVKALPIERMIGGPLDAMIQAQINASKQYADFIMGICVQDGKARMLQFDYDETLVDTEGNYKGVYEKTMRIPLLAALPHPNICIEKGTVDFELEITEADEETKESTTEGGMGTAAGLETRRAAMKGRVTNKSAQTRKTDTRARYSIHTAIGREPAPEAMMRVIDFLTDAATRPVLTPDKGAVTSTESLPGGATLQSARKADEGKTEGR